MPFGLLDNVPRGVRVRFGTEVQLHEQGVELTPTQVALRPVSLEWTEREKHHLYTVALVHPLLVKGKYREFLQWLAVNVDLTSPLGLSGAQTLAEYIGAGPVRELGLQPYVFLVYRQQPINGGGRIEPDEQPIDGSTIAGRFGHFRIANFAAKYGLGRPVVGTYFRAGYDDSVPELHRRLGFNPDAELN